MNAGKNKRDHDSGSLRSGAQEFPVKITAKDIAEIVDGSRQLRIEDIKFIKNATLEDVNAAYTLLSLIEFMKQRHVPAGFEVVLSE